MNKKNILLLILLATTGIVSGIWYTSTHQFSTRELNPPKELNSSPYANYLAADGMVEPEDGIHELFPPREDILAAIFVKEGELVRKGEPLYQLRTTGLLDELQILEAQRRSALAYYNKLKEEPRPTDVAPLVERLNIQKFELGRLELQLKRSETLVKSNAVSMSSHDDIRELTSAQRHRVQDAQRQLEQMQAGVSRYQLEQAQAEVAVMEGKIKAIKTKIEESTVKAPFDGVVLSVDQRVGDFVSQHDLRVTSQPSAPIVFGGRKMQIRVMIDERDVGKIKKGIRGVAYRRDGAREFLPLTFSHIVPMVTPRKQFTGIATERVDVRVLHVVFSFDSLPWNCYSGEQLGVFLDLDPVKE